jgi:hypothetical protein
MDKKNIYQIGHWFSIFKKKNQIWQFCQFFIKKISANLKMQMVVGETGFELENDRMFGGILNFEVENDLIIDGILSLNFQNADGCR